jgi:VWFA-related protein
MSPASHEVYQVPQTLPSALTSFPRNLIASLLMLRTAAALLLLSLSAIAQAQNDPAPKFRLDVNQVAVPVIVTDAKGHRKPNMTAADFELLEDGVPQKILSFSIGGETAPAASQTASAPQAPKTLAETAASRRTYAICVDTMHSAFANFAGTRAALQAFFDKEQRTDSQYWLVSLGKKPEVLVYPTPDPHAVLAALKDKKFLATIQNSESNALGSQVNQLRHQLDDYCGRCPCGRNTRPIPMECVGPKQSLIGLVTTSADRTSIYTEFFLKELSAMVTDLSNMPGNRVLILISDGFNLVPGREMYGVMRAYFPNEDRWQMTERDATPRLEPILKAAAAANIVVYGLNSSGLSSTAGVGGSFEASTKGTSVRGVGQTIMPELNRQASLATFESGTAMEALAKATGGAFVENSNDMLAGIRRAFDETRDYYILGYVSTNTALDGKYRTIEVKVKDPKAQVRARAGYWAQ